jgi:hypothetical protein
MIGKSSTLRQFHGYPDKPESQYIRGTQELPLCRNSQNSSRALALDRLELRKLHRTQMDSSRASSLELQGGLLTSREALWPSELHHSPDKAMPSYYTKNNSFASGISKMWCVF